MKKFILLFAVLVCSILLVGCGSNYRKQMAGKYTLLEMKSGKSTVTAKQLKKLGIEASLELKDDGTATLKMGSDTTKLTYDKKYFTEKSKSKGKTKYTFKKNNITLSDDDTSMTFEKK